MNMRRDKTKILLTIFLVILGGISFLLYLPHEVIAPLVSPVAPVDKILEGVSTSSAVPSVPSPNMMLGTVVGIALVVYLLTKWD